MKYQLLEYITDDLSNPFKKWFDELNAQAAAKVSMALYKMEQGNFSNAKSIGQGIWEYKIDFGPGYRIYYGRQDDTVILLLFGGNKKTQPKDIKLAQRLWKQYKSLRGQS
ncbi:MAG: type II toxin-antitoxin system RelE/ParE family toxin [Legionellales bacterium]|nr:type II toxin-antitoxin system RelE/ParE family toxin [Legionellales bacterium]